jgi:hypothetical protein
MGHLLNVLLVIANSPAAAAGLVMAEWVEGGGVTSIVAGAHLPGLSVMRRWRRELQGV